MGVIAGWLRGDGRGEARERAALVVWFVAAAAMWLSIISGSVAAVLAIAVTVVLIELRIWIRRRRRDRTDRVVARLIGGQLSDSGLEQVLDCWSKRYRRQ
jgi:hypothetical protein